MTDQTPIAPAIRHDGWTRARRAQFLDHLANSGDVRAACASVGLSREAAYRLRRREPLIARAWDAALVLARAVSAEALASRALDGVEEEIWYRGEVVGTRRKYDSRLLLAHMARLERASDDDRAREDAARFDELVLAAAGEPVEEGCECEDDGMPANREVHMDIAADDAEVALAEAWATEHPEPEEDPDLEEADPDEMAAQIDREVAENRDYHAALVEAQWRARVTAGAEWDQRVIRAHAALDRLLSEPLIPLGETGTVSTVSTSPASASAVPTPADGHAWNLHVFGR